ncbi:MAG: alpha-galactosidase [Arenicella sp.]|nr:alpha-galactosidase [Arenicella sp.]
MTGLIRVSKDLRFSLANARISYLFQVSPEGILEHLYFGQNIGSESQLPAMPRRSFRGATNEFEGIAHYNLSDIGQEYPLFGRSDARHPALHLINADGNTTNTLLYQSYTISKQKPPLKGLPSARGGDSETLLVTLVDKVSQLHVVLSYTVYQHHDVVCRSVEIFNDGEKPVVLDHALSSSLDLPAGDYDLLHLRGSWAREFDAQRMKLPAGTFSISSASGASSNHHNPFIAVMQAGTGEQHGRVIGAALMYSGNFAITVEQGEFGPVRMSLGINPFNFSWQLPPGESFVCPEALLTFSPLGLEGMSHNWHRFVREYISPTQFNNESRPSYLNSWEAAYFDLNEELVLQLAEQARSIGLQMLVVDDGWFAGRHNDRSSLGDWFSDKQKFPNGIQATAAKVKQKGLKFGLWMEPEMVSPDSDLYRAHPDWIIQVPGRTLSTGRNQLVLDLSRNEVVEYLFKRIDDILCGGDIDYIKWDMNRTMTEIGSTHLPSHQQLETAHRYILGVYQLLSRITSKYPDVLFENCASGGSRFDLGMLRYMSQGWVSDMSEPVGRLAIINGASYLFPLSVMASYIGPVPSHQNGRLVSLKMRSEVGFFCAARGLSLNSGDIDKDQQALVEIIKFYNATADDVVSGVYRRLQFGENEVCWQLSSADGKRIYVGYFHILSEPNLPFRRAYLRGLDAQARYQLVDSDQAYSGDALMYMGIDLPYVHAIQQQGTDYMDQGDFSSHLMTLIRVDGE